MAAIRSRRKVRLALAAAGLLLLALAAYALAGFGRFLAREDPLEKSDAIVVLAGTFLERPLEGADLYREGWAPVIVLTYGIQDEGIAIMRERGISLPAEEDQAIKALTDLGIPREVFITPPRVHDNTAQEAQTLRELATRRGWKQVIVVSSKYHLRRAGFAYRRELEGTGVRILMHGSRYDYANPDRWWATRGDLRWILSEGTKIAAYFFGLGA